MNSVSSCYNMYNVLYLYMYMYMYWYMPLQRVGAYMLHVQCTCTHAQHACLHDILSVL